MVLLLTTLVNNARGIGSTPKCSGCYLYGYGYVEDEGVTRWGCVIKKCSKDCCNGTCYDQLTDCKGCDDGVHLGTACEPNWHCCGYGYCGPDGWECCADHDNYCNPKWCQTCDGNGNCVSTCDTNQECCNGTCYDPVTKGCCNGEIYDKSTQQCCPGLFNINFVCDSNKTCCDTTCCDPKKCETCYNYNGLHLCIVCNNDPTLKCYNGHCCCAPNGCGPCSGVPSVSNNPAGCSDTSFLDACSAHDDCYGECHNYNTDDKDNCDNNFLQAMLNICLASSSPSCRIACMLSAETYYEAVHSRGQGAFDASQACSCD